MAVRSLARNVILGVMTCSVSVVITCSSAFSSEQLPKTYTDKVTGMEFVYIKGGCYKMGSPVNESGRYANESPVHEVCVDGFYMAKYEVTNAQYRLFKQNHHVRKYRGESLDADNLPAVLVRWSEAQKYIQWLNEKSQKSYRLPTEAEWEYAARGGTTTARYWGDDPDMACSYANVHDITGKKQNIKFLFPNHNCDDGYAGMSPVGSFKPNAFGLYDMIGDVWDWCSDWFDENYYSVSPRMNPQGPSSGKLRVCRGGGWRSEPNLARSAARGYDAPGRFSNRIGFRLVIDDPDATTVPAKTPAKTSDKTQVKTHAQIKK